MSASDRHFPQVLPDFAVSGIDNNNYPNQNEGKPQRNVIQCHQKRSTSLSVSLLPPRPPRPSITFAFFVLPALQFVQ